MMVSQVIIICLISLSFNSLQVLGNVGNLWGYHDGIPPANWPLLYPTCGGPRQSPINIDTTKAVLHEDLQPFNFSEIGVIHNSVMTIKNHAKTVEVDIKGKDLFISGGSLIGKYKVKQFHFHWGTADQRGSEHDFNGRQYPLEMHIVSYSSRYHKYEDALNSTGGIAVVGFLVDIGPQNDIFDDIITNFAKIVQEDDNVTIPSFQILSLLPSKREVYYRYYGSLTTPPCYESVIWTIFRSPITISRSQINKFRVLGRRHINKHLDIADNFRPIQPLNDRRIFTNDIKGISPMRRVTRPQTNQNVISRQINQNVLSSQQAVMDSIQEARTPQRQQINLNSLLNAIQTKLSYQNTFIKRTQPQRQQKQKFSRKTELLNPFGIKVSGYIKPKKPEYIIKVIKPAKKRKLTNKSLRTFVPKSISGKGYGLYRNNYKKVYRKSKYLPMTRVKTKNSTRIKLR